MVLSRSYPSLVKEGVMQKVFEHGKLRVTVEGPDLPEGVDVSVDLDLRAESEDAARGTIEALGGIGAFEDVNTGFGSSGWLRPKGASIASAFEISLTIPTGRERDPSPAPFLDELRDEQKALES